MVDTSNLTVHFPQGRVRLVRACLPYHAYRPMKSAIVVLEEQANTIVNNDVFPYWLSSAERGIRPIKIAHRKRNILLCTRIVVYTLTT